jgi:hypothetical protein
MSRHIYFFSNPKLFIYIYYVNILSFLYKVWYSFFPKPVLEKIKDETEIYIENQTQRFLNNFPKTEEERKEKNSNIDTRCYSLKSFQKLITDESNELEPEWKSRFLMESTPRGNIIMFYDIYKQAFAYFSDQHMNYPILNACAMKYVLTYRCFDFFIDGNILPDGIISPFVILQEELEKEEKEKLNGKKRDLGINFKDAPFAKLKTYKITDLVKEKKVIFQEDKPISTKIQPQNIFRYLGKIANLSLLQKPVKPVFKNLSITCPIESFDYLTYKNRVKLINILEEKESEDEKEDDLFRELDVNYDSTSTNE